MYGKLILVDCDGVLLDWEMGFIEWAREQPHVAGHLGDHFPTQYDHPVYDFSEDFNESGLCNSLAPLRDARDHVLRLANSGYHFQCITSAGKSETMVRCRLDNLRAIFGDVFSEMNVEFLRINQEKEAALSNYKDTGLVWVEDHPQNAIDGKRLGLRSVLIDHRYNKEFKNELYGIPRVENWTQVAEVIPY